MGETIVRDGGELNVSSGTLGMSTLVGSDSFANISGGTAPGVNRGFDWWKGKTPGWGGSECQNDFQLHLLSPRPGLAFHLVAIPMAHAGSRHGLIAAAPSGAKESAIGRPAFTH